MVCADNTVVILMRACDRGKSEARGTRSAEGASLRGTACGTCEEFCSKITVSKESVGHGLSMMS